MFTAEKTLELSLQIFVKQLNKIKKNERSMSGWEFIEQNSGPSESSNKIDN